MVKSFAHFSLGVFFFLLVCTNPLHILHMNFSLLQVALGFKEACFFSAGSRWGFRGVGREKSLGKNMVVYWSFLVELIWCRIGT